MRLVGRRVWSGGDCGRELFLGEDAITAIPTWVLTWLMLRVCGFLYLEIEVVCVEFGCHFEVELECELTLSSLDVLQGFSFFLQMGFTLILATFDGLDVGLLENVIGEDDCDDDNCDEEMSLVRMLVDGC
ncbi:hypothetical protein Tco_1423973 [Tanacetum coccineum]